MANSSAIGVTLSSKFFLLLSGLVFWIVVLAVPGQFLQLFSTRYGSLFILSAPLGLLLIGVFLSSPQLLLILFPLSLTAASVGLFDTSSYAIFDYSGVLFMILSASLYCCLALAHIHSRSIPAEAVEERTTQQHSHPQRIPPYPRYIMGLYTIFGVALFLSLTWYANFSDSISAALATLSVPQGLRLRLLLNLGSVAIWIIVCFWFLIPGYRDRFKPHKNAHSPTGLHLSSGLSSKIILLVFTLLSIILAVALGIFVRV